MSSAIASPGPKRARRTTSVATRRRDRPASCRSPRRQRRPPSGTGTDRREDYHSPRAGCTGTQPLLEGGDKCGTRNGWDATLAARVPAPADELVIPDVDEHRVQVPAARHPLVLDRLTQGTRRQPDEDH